MSEEELENVRRGIGPDSIDRLIHHAQTQFRARTGLPVLSVTSIE